MELYSDNHDEICHTNTSCPLCDSLSANGKLSMENEDLREANKDLQKEIDDHECPTVAA